MVTTYLKSTAAARKLGVRYYQLFDQIRTGRLAPPDKDSSGQYVWTSSHLDRARQRLEATAAGRGTPGAPRRRGSPR